MAASAEHPVVDPDSSAESPAARPVTEPARPARDSDPKMIEQRMQAALAASTRTEASLSTLFRAVREMTEGLSGARDANEQLVSELGDVRRMLRQATQRNAELESRLTTLEAEHETALETIAQLRGHAERERAFLVEEQDRFLAALIEEHDETVQQLRQKLDQSAARAAHATEPSRRAVASDGDAAALLRELTEARRTIESLVRERDRSREVLRRLQSQRDEAQRALDMQGRRQDAIRTVPRVAEDEPEPPAAPPRAAAPVPPQDAASNRRTNPVGPNRAGALGANPTPKPGSIHDRATQPPPPPESHPTPPPELRAAITAPPAPDAVPAPPRPTLKQKPDPVSRPLGGYSMKPEQAEETVDVSRTSSNPPRE